MTKDHIELDYAERDGFLVGKSAAIAEWSFRKEQREFERLCRNLTKHNQRKTRRAASTCVECGVKCELSLCPDHLALFRRSNEAWRRANGIKPQKYRLITHAGVTLHLSEWARVTGINAPTILMRLKAGWDVALALTQSPKKRAPKAFCKRGHARTPDNLQPSGNGGSYCLSTNEA